MKKLSLTIFSALLLVLSEASAFAADTDSTMHISRLEIKKGDKKTFSTRNRDSSLVLNIDTLIMGHKASLSFFGKKELILRVKHATIQKEAYIVGTDGKNNGTDMDIEMRFDELGKLYVLAGGRDANNGTRTYPNGNGGNVTFRYDEAGISPQSDNKKKKNYLRIDTRAGGYRVTPQTELYNIYSQIAMGVRVGNGRIGAVPQGQIYSGSPGIDGKTKLEVLKK